MERGQPGSGSTTPTKTVNGIHSSKFPSGQTFTTVDLGPSAIPKNEAQSSAKIFLPRQLIACYKALPPSVTSLLYPVSAVLTWWVFNVSTIIGNKIIFDRYHFRFPLTLTAVHFIISSFGAYISLKVLELRPLVVVQGMDLVYKIGPLATMTCLNVVLGNVSLKFIPVTFMQTIKAFTPATTVLIQRLFWDKRFDNRLYMALVPVTGGIFLSSMTELSFHFVGFMAAFSSCFVTSLCTILAEVLLQGKYELDSINAVLYMAPPATALLLPLALFFEFRDLYLWIISSTDILYTAFGAIIASGTAAFFLNVALIWAVQATSAVTFNVAGNLKVAVAIVIGWLVFQNPMSIYSSLGCVVTVAGCTVYGYVQHVVKTEQQMKHARSMLDFDEINDDDEIFIKEDEAREKEPLVQAR